MIRARTPAALATVTLSARDLMIGLEHGGGAELKAWMQAFNPGRG